MEEYEDGDIKYPNNRRSESRLPVQSRISVLCNRTHAMWIDGYAVDISWTGIRIKIPMECKAVETVTLSFSAKGKNKRTRNISVRWQRFDEAEKMYIIGCQFL